MAKKTEKGSLRLRAFALINGLLGRKGNMAKLRKAFQDSFDEDPVAFYKQFIRPTAEKELVIEPGSEGEKLSFRVIVTDGSNDEETEE